MADLIQAVMFTEDGTPGYSHTEVAALNFELMHLLGTHEPSSWEHMNRAWGIP
jgi:hypothetical protein